MGNIIQLFQEASFGPEMTRVMGEAFEQAMRSLQDQSDLMKEVVAKRIIDAMRRGIRDPRDLGLEATRGLDIKGDGGG